MKNLNERNVYLHEEEKGKYQNKINSIIKDLNTVREQMIGYLSLTERLSDVLVESKLKRNLEILSDLAQTFVIRLDEAEETLYGANSCVVAIEEVENLINSKWLNYLYEDKEEK